MPLLEGLDGIKEDEQKSEELCRHRGPPNEIFGKIMSIDDQLMIRYYELLTSRNLDEIKSLHPMEAKKRLAEEIIERYYNRDAAIRQEKSLKGFFLQESIPTDIPSYTVAGDKKMAAACSYNIRYDKE